jgi:exodeoxyribonuclease V gamma subunit
VPSAAQLEALLARELARLRRAGTLPLAGPGRAVEAAWRARLAPVLAGWQQALAAHPRALPAQTLRWVHPAQPAWVLDDAVTGLRAAEDGPPAWIDLQASDLLEKKGLRPRPLLRAWVRALALAACGVPAQGIVLGPDARVRVPALAPQAAQDTLAALLDVAHEGLAGTRPLPTALATGLAWLRDADAAATYDGGDYRDGERQNPSLARCYPDFETLAATPGFEAATRRLYQPLALWLDDGPVAERWPDAAGEGA